MGKKGIIGTLLFHAGLLLFVIIFGFITPLPLPDEEGILINFGTDDEGFGAFEPPASSMPEEQTPPPQEAAVPEESNEEVLAQDFEEAPVVEAEPEEKPEIREEEPADTPEENVEETIEEQPPPPEEEPPTVDPRAIYPGRRNTDQPAGSEGITEGDGNQGSVTGSPDSDDYRQGLSSGRGGTEFSLTGRNPVSLPKPDYNVQESGTVVVRIRVNREGVVTWAEAGARGGNTLNESLLEAARKAALKARFNSKQDATEIQQGTITYHFVLQ